MKVFDFTEGRKGELLGSIKRANSMGGCLVRKGETVYRVELANAAPGWEWHADATWLRWENGEPVEDVAITPEEFGVEAICFSTGKWRTGDGEHWQWTVVGTPEWNASACRNEILKFERN